MVMALLRICIFAHFFIIYLFPFFLISGEFTASVSQNVGDSVTLNLTLKDTSAKGSPSLNVLNSLFSIQSQAQSSNTTIINGNMTSSTSWKLTLIPKVKGEIEIPSISISTAEGVLFTQPLKVQAHEGRSTGDEFHLTQQVSNEKPYKNQPFFYTLQLNSKYNLTNLWLEKLEVEDAIVESAKTNDWTYVITPLKAGPLKIPAIRIQGEIIDREQRDPFARMWGFDSLKPFGLVSEEKVIEVQAPLAQPWLPAHSVKMNEVWNENQLLQVGEPITWSIKIDAVGVKANQLPQLNPASASFKIYADKPQMGDEVKGDAIHSFRKEHYTLIPIEAGSLVLPEVSFQWWDVNKNQMMTEKLPQRTLHVLPSLEKPKIEVKSEPEIIMIQNDSTWLYIGIGIVTSLFLGTLIWVIILQRKLKKLKEESKEKLPDLNPT